MSRQTPGIYVETHINGSMETLWEFTQEPDFHERWDLRFTSIEYLPRADEDAPKQFRYITRIGFGARIAGDGEFAGDRTRADGQRTSALKFWSDDPKSLIKEGAGYWKYVPSEGGIRFLTGYDYTVRFGKLGKMIDAAAFRPLIGWATAWSFDRLRLWIEEGIPPEVSFRQSIIYALSRFTLAFVWMYHGLVPKILFHHADEVALLRAGGIAAEQISVAINIIGAVEILFGLLILLLWNQRWLLWLTTGLMILTLGVVTFTAPAYLSAAFNPVSLNFLMIAMALTGLIAGKNIPSARRCLRTPREDE